MGPFFYSFRPDEENVLVGSIGCQADKTLDAVQAFVKLLKHMPISESRLKSAHTSILSNYRTSPIASRSIPGFVYNVDALGLQIDPRQDRFAKLEYAKLKDLEDFYSSKIQPRPILFSIVGNKEKIDMKELRKLGKIKLLEPGSLFNR